MSGPGGFFAAGKRRGLACAIALITLVVGALWGLTYWSMQTVATSAEVIGPGARRIQLSDREGRALNSTYTNQWNLFEQVALHSVPERLIAALVLAEDQRFYRHQGQDWLARCRALAQNIGAGEVVSGASTISEQVVRMLNPRPRTPWSRWLEGWEARRLEKSLGKEAILEFYLNQVPYAGRRRGVVHAARYYFDRDLATLSVAEILALAVLVRAPSRLDPAAGDGEALYLAMTRLAERMVVAGELESIDARLLQPTSLKLRRPQLAVNASHFLRYVQGSLQEQLPKQQTKHRSKHRSMPLREKVQGGVGDGVLMLRTTLDGSLQQRLQALLDRRLRQLAPLRVNNAALLVADHRRGEILAWVVGGAGDDDVPGHAINAVLALRQPGSALKPFLYALALEKGWTAATLIDDHPYSAALSGGLHDYRNYSRSFYGPVSLRVALGNSLNIPALKALRHTGVAAYHTRLRRLGFASLQRAPGHYGEGLALGNGEVSLLELVQGYAVLANRGRYVSLSALPDAALSPPAQAIFSPEIASLIGNILADPSARELEFGAGSVLEFPVQTAVKTGTSSDFRDSWALGYDARFVAGVWMGNLDQSATNGVTGSTGPALVLRATFDYLRRLESTRPLWLSPRLRSRSVCSGESAAREQPCRSRVEYFLPQPPGSVVSSAVADRVEKAVFEPERHDDTPPDSASIRQQTGSGIRLIRPSRGLHMAIEPRLPVSSQAFEFILEGVLDTDRVSWRVGGAAAATRRGGRYLWPLRRGRHAVSVQVHRQGELIATIGDTHFVVH